MRVVHHWAALGFVLLLSALLARNVDAWGDTGHSIICDMAFQGHCQVVEAETRIRRMGTPLRSSLLSSTTVVITKLRVACSANIWRSLDANDAT